MKRYCTPFIFQDLKQKMVFMGGPRQVGKTTLSQTLCQAEKMDYQYFNWDADADRNAILKQHWRDDAQVIIFDELHKYPHWKSWIKGLYDTRTSSQQYFVTGSARLDVYRRGGDSLLGRYHYWRLHPITIDELPATISPQEGLERLLQLGGFPEPFLQADERLARRWRRDRLDRIIREDVRDISSIRDIQLLSVFIDALRERAGSLVVLSNLAQDLKIAPKTAHHWLGMVEQLYVAFSVYPLTTNIPRSIQKPPKVYFYDNADVTGDHGAVLENLVATTLLKRLHFLEDYHGYRCQLHYIRDRDGREIDFATVIDGKLHELIEVKCQDTTLSKSLLYYQDKLQAKHAVQLVAKPIRAYDDRGIRVMSIADYFNSPPWEQH